MAGFPLYTLNKFVEILIENNYTVVIIEQISASPNPIREVTKVISPSTYNDSKYNSYEEKYLMTIYLSNAFSYKTNQKFITASIAIFDISTGKTHIYENNFDVDTKLILDDIYRIRKMYNPKEVVIFGDHSDELSFDKIASFLEISALCLHNNIANFSKEVLDINYQKQLLKKVFTNCGMLSVIEYCNLERHPNSVIAFVYLLRFVFEHDSNYIKNVSPPTFISNNEKLILEFNCIKKLDVFSDSKAKKSSLLGLLNNCSTHTGKRFFKSNLLSPITDCNILNKRYDNIELLLKKNRKKYIYDEVRKELTCISDIERNLNNLICNKLHPHEFASLNTTLYKVIDIYGILEKYNITNVCDKFDVKICNELITYLENVFDMEELPKYNLENMNTSFYKADYNVEIDKEQRTMNTYTTYFERLVNKLNGAQAEFSSFFKVERNDRDGTYLSVTSKRFATVISKLKANFDLKIDDLDCVLSDLQQKAVINKSTAKITSDIMLEINEKMYILKDSLKSKIVKCYNEICTDIYDKFRSKLNDIVNFINDIDFYSTCAYNSHKV